jgi:enterochelin esterase-like enzyme
MMSEAMKRLICWCVAGVATLTLILITLVFLFPDLLLSPMGFDVRREGIERGKVETVECDSKVVGCKRRLRVYTPPGLSNDQEYPVLYLLHGGGSDETSWVEFGAADTILDNLYADKRLVPMIVVMPDCNLLRAGDTTRDGTAALAAFGPDLLDQVIPYVEKHFPVKADREHRALAGASVGARQALDFGITHPHTFAYIGVFIGGLEDCEHFEKEHQEVLKDLGAKKRLNLLWVANGKNDFTYESCQNTLRLLDKYKIPYVYNEGKGIHSWESARNKLSLFAPLIFRDAR